jgi:hypothetical protein
MTAIYADTSQILHRAKAPTTTERYSLTFQYSSRKPRHVFPHCMLSRQALQELRHTLTPRQRSALLID